MPSQNVEEYVEAIYRLEGNDKSVSTGELAAFLGVAAPSVTTMLKRLVRDGLVTHTPYRGINLTEAGREMAVSLVRGHRLSERLLTDVIGLHWDEVHKVACKLEHVITGELADRVHKALGEPETCPHGNAVSGEDVRQQILLNNIEVGCRAVISRITNEEQDFLLYIQEQGLKPGIEIKVLSRSPFGDVTSVEVEHGVCAIGKEASSWIWVERLSEQE